MKNKLIALFPILLLTAGHGAVDSYLGFLQVLAPGLSAHLNIPLGDLVMLVGIGTLVSNVLQPFIGYFMGKWNLAWALGVAVALSALPAFMGFVPGYWSLVALVVLGAVGTALYHPEGVLSAHDAAAGGKVYLGIPLFMAGGGGIYALLAPVSVRITETYGFHALAWLVVPGLVVAALLVRSYRIRKKKHPSIVIRPRSKRMTRVQDGNISFWPLLAVGTCFCAGSGMFLSLLASHFELLFGPSSRAWSGWTLMVLGVASALCSFMWSALSERYGFYKIALLTQLIALPLFVFMAYLPSPEVGFLLAIPLSIVAPAAVHPAAVILSRNAAGSTQAMRSGMMVGATYAVASLVVILAGVLLRRQVSSSFLFLFVALCSLVAVLLSLWQLLAARKRQAKA